MQARRAFFSMKQQEKHISVINTASVVALVGSATPQLAYTASKGVVLAMTRDGYCFNSLCLSTLNTPLLQDWLGDDSAKRHRREVHFPTGKFGEAVEQARAVVFLASDDSGFYNGQELVVDGGLTKAYVTPKRPALAAPKNNAFGR